MVLDRISSQPKSEHSDFEAQLETWIDDKPEENFKRKNYDGNFEHSTAAYMSKERRINELKLKSLRRAAVKNQAELDKDTAEAEEDKKRTKRCVNTLRKAQLTHKYVQEYIDQQNLNPIEKRLKQKIEELKQAEDRVRSHFESIISNGQSLLGKLKISFLS